VSHASTLIVRVTDLEDLMSSVGPALPGWLRRFLRHGESRRLEAAAGGTDLVFDRPLPVAPLTRRVDLPVADAEGEVADYWLRADPVGLRADMRAVWVLPGRAVQPEAIEPPLKALFAEYGYEFRLPHPHRGYLKLPGAPDCRFLSPQQTAGKSLDELLPEGRDASDWRRLGNEVQMVLHQAAGQGDLGFQGLWFWGGGSLPASEDTRATIDWLSSSDIVLRAAADWNGIKRLAARPDTLANCPKGRGLVDWSAQTADSAAANLDALGEWLKPARRSLRWGRLASLTLAGREQAFRLTSGQLWWPLRA